MADGHTVAIVAGPAFVAALQGELRASPRSAIQACSSVEKGGNSRLATALHWFRKPNAGNLVAATGRLFTYCVCYCYFMKLSDYIRDIPDFPKPGILFRDITPLLACPAAFREAIEQLASRYRGQSIDAVAAAEARGFIFAAPLALELNASFVPVRKPGKLPYNTHTFEYELEYGSDTLQIHVDGVSAGQRVLLVDDLLATGGTIDACCRLVEKAGATVVGCAFAVELSFLGGRARIAPHETFSLVQYS
jgi:adenine phosphoribosyltransferase